MGLSDFFKKLLGSKDSNSVDNSSLDDTTTSAIQNTNDADTNEDINDSNSSEETGGGAF